MSGNIDHMQTRTKSKNVAAIGQITKTGRAKKKAPAITAKGTFIVGKTLPEKLSKATKDFFNTGVTPQKAFDIVARFKTAQAGVIAETKPVSRDTKPKRKAQNVC